MLACVLASLYAWQQDPNWADQNLVFSLNNLYAGRVWTLVTALFVHAGWEHLLGNLPFLFVFGNTLEKMIGRNNHLLVFFLGGFTSFLLPPLIGIYSPDTGKIYMISVDQAVDGNMNLRFKSAGVIRSNGRQSWRVSYEEAVNSGVNYWWAEDYEI